MLIKSMCENEVKIVQWTHEDGAKQGSPILGYGGVFGVHEARASKNDQERCSILRDSRPLSSSSSGMCKAKV
jgi:hypothetical protein